MTEQEYKDLHRLLCKYKSVLDPDEYELKNDIEFVIMDVRTSALDNCNITLKEE